VGVVSELITRPAQPADAPALHRLIAAIELRLHGREVTALDSVVADLSRTTMDLSQDSLLVYDTPGELAGWAWSHLGKRGHVYVHPGYEGRGLGTWLLDWNEARSRELGRPDIGQTVDDANTAALAILHARGYRPEVTQWQLEIALNRPPAEVTVPAGISFRAFRAGEDEQAAYRMIEEAFMDWQSRHLPYEGWAKLTIDRDTFAPALSPLAFDGERLVGAVLSLDRDGAEGHVERVAVDREYRRRGIGQALLRQAFADFTRSGKRTCVLFTHSRTGALALYEKAGMTVTMSSTHLRRPLP
jgi:mycothiol synthase